jgi:hypothetical protein
MIGVFELLATIDMSLFYTPLFANSQKTRSNFLMCFSWTKKKIRLMVHVVSSLFFLQNTS